MSTTFATDLHYITAHASYLQGQRDALKHLIGQLHSIDYGRSMTPYLAKAEDQKERASLAFTNAYDALGTEVDRLNRYARNLEAAEHSFIAMCSPGGVLGLLMAGLISDGTPSGPTVDTGSVEVSARIAIFRISKKLQASFQQLPNGKVQIEITPTVSAGLGVGDDENGADLMVSASRGTTFVVSEKDVYKVLLNQAAQAKVKGMPWTGPRPFSTMAAVTVSGEANLSLGGVQANIGDDVSVQRTVERKSQHVTLAYEMNGHASIATSLGSSAGLGATLRITRDHEGHLLTVEVETRQHTGVVATSPAAEGEGEGNPLSGSVDTSLEVVTKTTLDLSQEKSLANELSPHAGDIPDLPTLVAALQSDHASVVTTRHHVTTVTGKLDLDAELADINVKVEGSRDTVIQTTQSYTGG